MRQSNNPLPNFRDVLKTAAREVISKTALGTNGGRYTSSMLVQGSNLERDAFKQFGGNSMSRFGQSMDANISTPPNFYSPFLTVQAFQIPNNRKEVYLWASFFYDNDAKVAAGINFYRDFIFSGFTLECSSSYVKDYFEKLCKKLNFSKILPLVSHEYHLRGDAFVHAEFVCDKCEGTSYDMETGELCKHEGASYQTLTLLDPMSIEISGSFLGKEPTYFLVPSDDMMKIVQSGFPADVYNAIPTHMKETILQKKPLQLDRTTINHFKRAAPPWSPYGTSLVRSLFPVLAYKDKLRQANYIVADRHILPVRVVKVGNDARPANQQDIQNVQEQLAARANDPLLTIVTHHAFTYEWFGAGSAVLSLAGEHDTIENDLLDGMMVSKDLLSGLGGPSNANNISLLAMDRRLEAFRLEIAQWMEEKIFKTESERQGFIIEGRTGEKEIVYPTVKWKDLELRDQSNKLQILQALQGTGAISLETLYGFLEIDYDQEVERLRFEQTSTFMPQAPTATLDSAMPGLPGAPLGGAPAPGGSPAPAAPLGTGFTGLAPASSNKTDNYKFVGAVIHNMVQYAKDSTEVEIPEKYINKNHERFIESLISVSGRGKVGTLSKSFSNFENIKLASTITNNNGSPMNLPAVNEIISNNRMVKTAENNAGENIKTGSKSNNNALQPPKIFTKLEQKLYNIILRLNLQLPFYAQFEAGPKDQYRIDAAFPSIRLGIEADSETYHSNSEAIAKDKQRDQILAGEGWVILRFTDKELRDKEHEVGALVAQIARQLLSQYAGYYNGNDNTI